MQQCDQGLDQVVERSIGGQHRDARQAGVPPVQIVDLADAPYALRFDGPMGVAMAADAAGVFLLGRSRQHDEDIHCQVGVDAREEVTSLDDEGCALASGPIDARSHGRSHPVGLPHDAGCRIFGLERRGEELRLTFWGGLGLEDGSYEPGADAVVEIEPGEHQVRQCRLAGAGSASDENDGFVQTGQIRRQIGQLVSVWGRGAER